MSNATKVVIPLLLLAAVAGGVAYFLNQSAADTPLQRPTPAVTPTKAVQDPQPEPAKPATAPIPQEPTRTAVTTITGAAHADEKQGVRGRVLQPDGVPAANVPVMLLESSMNDPIKIFLNNKMGKITPPLAMTQTAADGTFTLGMRQLGKSVDLRVVSEQFPEISQQQLKVREGDWYDTGDLRLEVGVVIEGHVVEEGSRAPIAAATVFMSSSAQSHAMSVTPGRERGVTAMTDPSGYYRFTNGPRLGLVNLAVEAPGFASTQLLNQQLKVDATNDFTLEVERGLPIAGVTVDANGKPVSDVTITANGLSSKTPQTATTVSRSDGTFEFEVLRQGPYHLMATSPSHIDAKAPMILTGDMGVKLVLGERAVVKLQVLSSSGAPVKAYRLSLKRYFPNNPLGIANVLDFSDRNVNPSDYPAEFGGQFAAIRGLPPGEFRFQLEDNAHAKTLSPPFTVAEGGPVPEVVAQLTLGASIMGTVTDERGQPVANASVTTDMNGGIAADSGLLEMFRSMMPEKHSKSQTKTDRQGRFRLNKLAFAEYMVRVAHPDYCEGSAINIKLENEGQVYDAGVIQVTLGALIEGTTSVEGLPTGQIKVTVSTTMTEGMAATDPQSTRPSKAFFNATVISDGDGHFRMLKRVPPGEYKITASRQSTDSPFSTLMDMKQTEQQLRVAQGQDRVELNFNLSKR